ncbi:sigma-70 family RNA polymerase sigma factor [Sphingomonas morindae]|uniref:Sigma-70 family RNA polymerase sigma factor n=1 Tax=Sphingomonas morindae TaxID=1541170 RepID=A0ABY4X9R9_9SPHN|nr:sigma-70 family RNA polymerase sigma factor [Sphingomonas morindae]USI73445.1 sigma-70 family RNA polymerase sigma factor [Sphingomonas morindae]
MRSTDPEAASLAKTLARVAAGDRSAFEEVYRRTSAKLFSVCLRILPVRQEAEEALQEAYLTVWRKAATFDLAKGSAMTWLILIARSRALDRRRGRGAAAAEPIELAEAVADPAPGASTLLELGEEVSRLDSCLALLATGDAQLIRTAFFEGLTYSQLAARIDTPLGTIKSRIRRALLKLRDCLA